MGLESELKNVRPRLPTKPWQWRTKMAARMVFT